MQDLLWLAFGLGLFGLGAVGYRYAYTVALYEEKVDAIGSKTPIGEVEPAGWKVTVGKGISALVMIAGGLYSLVMLVAVLT